MNESTISLAEAATLLRTKGFTVKIHGARYLVGATAFDTSVLTGDELIAFAQRAYGVVGVAHDAETPQEWTAACATCGQSFISDTPVADGARCPSCATTATEAHQWEEFTPKRARGAKDMTTTTAPATEREYITTDAVHPASRQAQLAHSVPMLDLVGALDDHAKHLPKPLPTDYRIPVPAGLPERLNAPIGIIVTGRYQPRKKFDEEKQKELAASITEHGILNPLLVFANERGNLELIGGERRLRAASLANLMLVPVEIRSYTLRQIDEISTIDNLQREDLVPIDEGQAYERMIATWGISEAELAKRLGKNRSYIQQRRAIASAAPEVIQALEEGALTFSQARAIAVAAPTDPKAQKAAVLKVAEMAKSGQRTTEATARAAAEKVVLGKSKKTLQALGWSIHEAYAYTVIWAPGERPRQWTGAEILETIRDQRKPSAIRPESGGKEVGEAFKALRLRYKIHRDHQPWIGLAPGYNDLPTFYAPAELPALAEPIASEWAALVARYTAQGWTLKASGGADHVSIEAKGAKGAYRSMYTWGDAEQLIAHIETGKVKDEAQRGPGPTTYKCDDCKKPINDYRYIDNRRLCRGCAAKIEQALALRQARIAVEVASVMQPWLHSAPLDVLRLLGASLALYAPSNPAEFAESLRAMSATALADTLLQRITDRADAFHASPIWSVAPTPATELPGSSPAEPAPVVPADDSGIGGIRAGLANIERTIGAGLEDEGEIRACLADLDAMVKDLRDLADAPDVTNEQYEQLAATISAHQRTLRELLAGDA